MTKNEQIAYDNLKSKLEKLKYKNDVYEAEISTLKSENKIISKQLQTEVKEKEKLLEFKDKKYDELYCEISKVNDEIVKLQDKKKEDAKLIKKLNLQIAKLNETIVSLRAIASKDSTTSSKPSSTDTVYKKKKHINTSRVKTDRKVGGQIGHKGHNLTKAKAKELIESGNVKHVIKEHFINGENNASREYILKYVIDIETTTIVEEHRFYVKNSSEIPAEFCTDVQYGNKLKSFVAIEVNEGFVSINRTKKIIKEITGNSINISEGTIVNISKELAVKSIPVVERIKQMLIKAGVLHSDETGVRVNGALNWLHTATTKMFTYYQVESKRGKEGMDNLGILEYYVGVLVHDHLKAYYQYTTLTHAECNAHILRYLKHVIEIFKREGATKFLEFLVSVNNEKKGILKQVEKKERKFSNERIEEIEKEYTSLLEEWEQEYNKYVKDKKISKSLTDEKNLISRLLEYKKEHLVFVTKMEVPFDNNLAEQAIRMIKTKLKVSGCFRGKDKGNNFAIIRSLFETTKKHGMNLFDTIKKVFDNEEIIFQKI